MTEYEIRVPRLVFQGRAAQASADALGLKRKTIYCHMWHVHQKLGTYNALQVCRRLEEMGLMDRVMWETQFCGEKSMV